MLSSVTKEKLAEQEMRNQKEEFEKNPPCTKTLIDSIAETPLPQQHS